MNLDHAVRIWSRRHEAERNIAITWSDQGNAFADKRRNNADDELVDRARIKERPDEVASSHQPHVLAGVVPDAFRKSADRFGDELDARGGRARRPAREHVVRVIFAE